MKTTSNTKLPPLWQGPEVGGITQSLLGRYLVCKERFRIHVMEGLRPTEGFNHRIEYGNMWHVCEESYAGHDAVASKGPAAKVLADNLWQARLTDYAKQLCRRYPLQQQQVEHWYQLCKAQFPLYVQHWAAHPDVTNRTPLLQEEKFVVPYKLPSGRTVKLRGKLDSVDLVKQHGIHTFANKTTAGSEGIWLMENKTKGDIDEAQIRRQLTFDLQTMFYLVAIGEAKQPNSDFWRANQHISQEFATTPLRGVRYNVVRRPCSGGKGDIRQGKAESLNDLCLRLRGKIREDPGNWFMRWKVEVWPEDVVRFRRQCLDPLLENVLDDWEWWERCHRKGEDVWDAELRSNLFTFHTRRHFRLPFGVYNPLLEGNAADLDDYLRTGSTVGLERATTLFPELEG